MVDMPRVSDMKERLLDAAMDLIWHNSYGTTSVDAICERAGAKKGSFYYFFKSKSELAAAALDADWDKKKAEMDSIFSPTVPPLERLDRYFDFVHGRLAELQKKCGSILGCPLLSIGSEVSTQDQIVREAIDRIMNNKTFSGKVALVTGGTSGIGKTTAIEFARAGAKVVLTGRREKEGAQVVAEIKKLGGEAAFVRADVAKDADVKGMVDFTVEKFGRLDIAFNNAGVEWKGPLDQATEAEYRRIFDINVWGVLNSMRHEIPVMAIRTWRRRLSSVPCHR